MAILPLADAGDLPREWPLVGLAAEQSLALSLRILIDRFEDCVPLSSSERGRENARMFAFDGGRELSTSDCSQCGRTYERVVGFVLMDGDAYAIYRGALHHHEGHSETWLDITFDDDWAADGGVNRTTFGCRLGPFGSEGDTAASLVLAGMAYPPDASTFGLRLSREDALAHARLPDLWALVDWLVDNDPDLASHIQS